MQSCSGTPPTCASLADANVVYGVLLAVVLLWIVLTSLLVWRRSQPGSTSRPARVMGAVVFVIMMAAPVAFSIMYPATAVGCLAVGLVLAFFPAYITYGLIERDSPEHVKNKADLYRAAYMLIYRLVNRTRKG
jgi:hypothetical protein